MSSPSTILIGNSFPVSLIRTRAVFAPVALDDARELLRGAQRVISFWGHENTLRAAETVIGIPLAPATDRPALTLDHQNLPGLDHHHTDTVLILSPEYRPGYRPAIGTEPTEKDILSWQCLRVTFKDSNKANS